MAEKCACCTERLSGEEEYYFSFEGESYPVFPRFKSVHYCPDCNNKEVKKLLELHPIDLREFLLLREGNLTVDWERFFGLLRSKFRRTDVEEVRESYYAVCDILVHLGLMTQCIEGAWIFENQSMHLYHYMGCLYFPTKESAIAYRNVDKNKTKIYYITEVVD